MRVTRIISVILASVLLWAPGQGTPSTVQTQPASLPAGMPSLAWFMPLPGSSTGYISHGAQADIAFYPTRLEFLASQAEESGGLSGTAAAQTAVQYHFLGSSPEALLTPPEGSAVKINRLTGAAPSGWVQGAEIFTRLGYRGLYPGIDLEFQYLDGALEGIYRVQPGADPNLIRWAYQGTGLANLDGATGDLVFRSSTSGATLLTEKAPLAWQDLPGGRQKVAAHYRQLAGGSLAFELGAYDRSQPLWIDPTLTFAGFFGGSGKDSGQVIARDEAGNIYLAGTTDSSDFPLLNPLYKSHIGGVFALQPGDKAWKPLSTGLPDGQALGLVADPKDPAVLYIYTKDQGVFKSKDQGASWAAASKGLPEKYRIQSLLVDAASPTTLYAGISYKGVYKSTDGGQNWALLGDSNTVLRYSIDVLAVSPAQPNILYASDSFTFYQSNDGGEHWKTVPGDIKAVKAITFNPQSPDDHYLLANSKLYHSKDAGKTWAVESDKMVYDKVLVIDPAKPQRLFSGSDQGVRQSSDGGKNWTWAMTNYMPIIALALNPNNSQEMYAGTDGQGLFVTRDGGASWERANDGLTSGSISGLAFTAGKNASLFSVALSGASDAYLLKLDPTGKKLIFATLLGGIGNETVAGLAVDAQGSAYLAGATQSPDFPLVNPYQSALKGIRAIYVSRFSPDGSRLIYSTLLGGTDRSAVSSLQYAMDIAIDKQGNAYLTGATGANDFPLANPLVAQKQGIQNPIVAELDPTGSKLLFSTYLGGSETSPFYGSWGRSIALDAAGNIYILGSTSSATFPLVNPLVNRMLSTYMLFFVKIDAAKKLVYSTYLGGKEEQNPVALAVAPDGTVYGAGSSISTDFMAMDGLQKDTDGGFSLSLDGGESWQTRNQGLSMHNVNAFAVAPGKDAPTLYIGTSLSGVFRSTDSGKTWENIRPGNTIDALAVDPNDPKTIYASTLTEPLLISKDEGKTWAETRLGKSIYVRMLAFVPNKPGLLYIGSIAQGLYRFDLKTQKLEQVGSGVFPSGVDNLVSDPQNSATLYAPSVGKLFKSTDGGDTWQQMKEGLSQVLVNSLAVSPVSSQNLFIGTDKDGVLVSKDGGASWQPAGSEKIGSVRVLLAAGSTQVTLYAATDRGIYISKDAGAHWTQKINGLAGQSVTRLVLDAQRPNTLYAGSSSSGQAFIFAFDPNKNQFKHATFFGGSGGDAPSDLKVDSQGNVYLLGSTDSQALPLADPLQASLSGPQDAFLAKLSPDLSRLLYSTYLGGDAKVSPGRMAVSPEGEVFFTGSSALKSFQAAPQYQNKAGSGDNAFLAVVNPNPPTPTPLPSPTPLPTATPIPSPTPPPTAGPTALPASRGETPAPAASTPTGKPAADSSPLNCLKLPALTLLVAGAAGLASRRPRR